MRSNPSKKIVNAKEAQIAQENAQIDYVMAVLQRRVLEEAYSATSPHAVKSFLMVRASKMEREIFSVLYLDVKHRILKVEDMSLGTLTHCSVYPREIVKAVLRENAAGVIITHNHPSGDVKPSESDVLLTERLKKVLEMIDVPIVDHLIVAGADAYSFAEHGML
jgi:DNA repair protein RadC